MSVASLLPVLVLLADPSSKAAVNAGGEGWEQTNATDGVTVFSRKRTGTEVTELKATGLIDAPAATVWKILIDYPNYPKVMPYMDAASILGTEDGGKVLYVYNRVSAP